MVQVLFSLIGGFTMGMAKLIGLDNKIVGNFFKKAAKGTLGASMLVTCIGAVFCLTFMISLGILGGLYYKYSPTLGISRSLNIAYLGKPPKYASRLLLQTEEKAYPYLCSSKFYHSFETDQKSTLGKASDVDSSKSQNKRKQKKRQMAELSPSSFCDNLKKSYFDRLNLEQQLYTMRVTMVDEHKQSRMWDDRKLRVELSIAYLQHKKTRVKRFESIFYLQQRTLFGSTRLRLLWEWIFPMQQDSYVSGDIIVDNSNSELLAMFVSVPAVRGLRLQQVNVVANLDLSYLMYILARLLPVFLVVVAFFIASNVSTIIGILVSLMLGKCLQKGWLTLDFGLLAEDKSDTEGTTAKTYNEAAIPTKRQQVYDDLD